jgi:NADP-dependent 3-hydroxy acid dehydrogenase YdfG
MQQYADYCKPLFMLFATYQARIPICAPEQHGAQVETAAIDVTDESGMQRLVETSIEQGVELIIANAGVSEGTVRVYKLAEEDWWQ